MKRSLGLSTLLRGLLVLLFAVWFLWQMTIFIRICWWIHHNPESTSLIKVRTEERAFMHRPLISPRPWVAYREIPDALKRAVIAAEDAQFARHNGFDWEGIQTAIKKDVRRGRFVAGGSTITQQLAKNLFLSERRSVFRKLEEAVITLMMESVWSKPRILEIYLNSIEWGDGVFGCQAAAKHYFQASVTEISAGQAARLAAMIPNPRFYDHHRSHPKLLNKEATLLARMPLVTVPK
jgi:monofunctional biosynthetic peptidoglycan transglycosylase